MRHRQTSRGLVGFAERHRVAVTFLTLFLMASPGRPDDRVLLQANTGARTQVLLILDSSNSMNNDFSDLYRLPAYMDDFLYPQGTFPTDGSKMGVAKSVLREVLTETEGVNWAFTYYRNPNQTFGAQTVEIGTGPTYSQQSKGVGGAQTTGEVLENGGLEWLYFTDTLISGGAISSVFPATSYPDIQQGRFLQLGHKVPHHYGKPGLPSYPPFTVIPEVADTRLPYMSPAGVAGNPAAEPFPGEFRGAFGPHGLNEGTVVYRNGTQAPGRELRMRIVSGNYGDPSIVLEVQEWGAPPTPTMTPTNTNTPTDTSTSTPTETHTPTRTATSSQTPTSTETPTPTETSTITNTPTASNTRTSTVTPSITLTSTLTPTASQTRTASMTRTASNTPTRTRTRTPSNTRTSSRTRTPSNTRTRTLTPTITNTRTQTFTASQTPTSSQTPTASLTATRTLTPTSSNTPTRTNTSSQTPTRTSTLTSTNTPTRTHTRTNTPTFTRTATPTDTPPPVPTFSGGAVPGPSLLPLVARWIAPAVRGLFAMAPPPPPPPPAPTCPGIPALYGPPQCAPCPGPYWDPNKLCAFVDSDGDGVITAADSPLPPSLQFAGVPGQLPAGMRGFDDPQADPDPTLLPVQTVQIVLRRADIYMGYVADDLVNGNPPWGSQPGDADADAIPDGSSLPDRHNQGMYSAIVDNGPGVNLQNQQIPGDSFGEPSCPVDATRWSGGVIVRPCDPYTEDCGGFARHSDHAPTGFVPYPVQVPVRPDLWPVVPFQRGGLGWITTDTENVDVIKRLLRFTSSIVSYDSSAPATSAYRLQEDAKNVVQTAPMTPISEALLDAYNYLKDSAFPDAVDSNDPAINCRNYIIVFVTDGIDECAASSCTGGPTGLGPSGDLGALPLPDNPPGSRAAAKAFDPRVDDVGVPVYMVALMDSSDPRYADLQCIADNTDAEVFSATDRDSLKAKLRSILDLKNEATFFAAPSVPAFASGFGDTAQIGAVIPSHKNVNGDLSIWSIWNGSLKSYKLSGQGLIPVITAAPSTPTASPTPGGPTATPIVATPTPTPIGGPVRFFPDETDPDNGNASLRKPVWNAARVLGYTDPLADLAESAASLPANPSSRAPEINVWPGRKMVFARAASGVPLLRSDFMPNTGGCTGIGVGNCFDDLMVNMGLTPTGDPANQTKAIQTVQFLRGGKTAYGSRDEILNDVKPATVPTIGPGTGEAQKYSYFYQDDFPAPGGPPQVRTDDDGNPPLGYPHKLGDIFHSEPLLLEPPRYFQYISANLAPPTSATTFGEPYIDFANRQGKRRKVVFVGSNDGFLHSFDAGVWNRDAANFPSTHDLGTGREIFAYAPREVMNVKFPDLLEFTPQPAYFVDGSMASADVFMDPSFNAVPDETERVWRTVLVGTLRQGGSTVYALDVTQPDDIDTVVASPTFGQIVGDKDASPGCLDGGGTSCVAGATTRQYPEVLWEMTDVGSACSDGCTLAPPAMGETWSRPVVGRIKVYHPASPTADASGFDSRFVAIFGGGLESGFVPGSDVSLSLPRGRAFYIVDVETGKILFKTAEGIRGGGATVNFAPMPAAPAVADYNDDGYLDVAYIGDMNGQMFRIDLTPDSTSTPIRGEFVGTQLHGYKPFLLFDGCEAASGVCATEQPIFYEPGIVFLGGAATPPVLGIAFGTGNRSELTKPVPSGSAPNSFFYAVDSGQTATTLVKADLRDLTPVSGLGPCPIPYDPATCPNSTNGFVLDFSLNTEKATSTVFSTQGFLSIITFTPESANPCATDGSSFRYRFFFLSGGGGYGAGSAYSDFQEDLGEGLAAASQSTSPQGDIIDTVLFSGGSIQEDVTPGTLRTIEQNWKEQQ